MNIDFLILAAGQGSRLKPITNNIPKGLVKVKNVPIIKNHLNIARKYNIKKTYIVTGYKASKIKFKHIKKIYNKDFETSNMVHSLYLALKEMVINKSDLIISYSDIVFNESVFKELIKTKNKFSIICDDEWQNYWVKRFKNIYEDAESCKIDKKGYLTDIGQKINSKSKISSQYIGLVKFSNRAKNEIYRLLKKEYLRNSKYSIICKNKNYFNLYFTDLLQYLIKKKNKLRATRIKGNWVEIDSIKDLHLANKFTSKKKKFIVITR